MSAATFVSPAQLLERVLERFRNPRPTRIKRPDGRVDYAGIRAVYAANMSDILSRAGWVDPYFADWPSIFTPIESQMWMLIRSHPEPYYPQFPVGRFFVDFGNPHTRTAIECDGRCWHDTERDEARDLELKRRYGWKVVRFSGRTCYRIQRLPNLSAIGFMEGVDAFDIEACEADECPAE